MHISRRYTALMLTLLATVAVAESAQVDEAYFENHVRPLLIEHCYECHSHSAGESMGELRLDTAEATRRGGTHGPSLVPGNPSTSLLLTAVGYEDPELQMPPEGKLSELEIDHLRTWIAGGAPDPRTDDPAGEQPGQSLSPLQRDPNTHWAFVPPQRIDLDLLRRSSASDVAGASSDRDSSSRGDSADQDPIDTIARREAAQAGLTPAPRASQRQLLRRLSYDLHGLPAPADEIAELQSDPRPDALRRRIDRMLADPRFAERFARHWLDVARYADTIGYAVGGKDRNLKHAYRYRDWVIDAIGRDMPYDDMIRHQLAGDQTVSPESNSGPESNKAPEPNNADAMGFLTLGRHFLRRDDTIDDRIDVITRGFLGLTVSCARCHDHKFDPIPTIDYYSLYNVLDNSVPPSDPESAASPLMLVEREPLRDTRVFIRGNRSRRGDVAPRRYLTAFRNRDNDVFSEGSGRRELAEMIADADNPLTSRVMVNRVWAHLLARPLVDSPSDFGFRTEAPPLQAVLDDLAADFATHWSLKRLVRRIVNSRIYQQSVQPDERASRVDPDNRLWTHALRKRLDLESMRDSLLVGCDYLNDQIGGPSVKITERRLTPRRTLYARINRQNLPGLFRTFDFANPDMHSPGRYFTTVPQQPLFLLNHPQMAHAAHLAAQAAASQIIATTAEHSEMSSETLLTAPIRPDDASRIVGTLFRQILAREPTADEQADAVSFLSQRASENPLAFDRRDAWRYGTGTWDNDTLTDFKPLAVFKNKRWQFEDTFPSPGPMSYASLTPSGGHPAHGTHGAVVRRWTSPGDGNLRLSGSFTRPSEKGDSILAVVQIRGETVWSESIDTGTRTYDSIDSVIHRGEHVDMIVTSNETLSFDGFRSSARMLLTPASSDSPITIDSVAEFSGPHERREMRSLSRVEQLAQVLFLSNEFLFVD